MASTDSTDSKTSENNEEVSKLKKAFEKKIFTMEEVAKHNTEDKPWVIVHGAVYDMTDFQLDHPGGPDVLQDIAGQDATEEFENILHTEKARKMGHEYLIGSIQDADFEKWLENMNQAKTGGNTSDDGTSQYLIIIIVVILAIVGYYFYNQK